MELEWNDGQYAVVEHKTKGDGWDFKNTAKFGEAGKDGAHKVALEWKGKIKMKQFGGMTSELKVKNSGEFTAETWCDYLKQFEGFDGVQLYAKAF